MTYRLMPQTDPARQEFKLRPYRSLTPRGFVWFIGLTAGLLGLPLLAQLGTAGLWVLLPFLVAAVWGVWLALKVSYRTESETLTLTPTEIVVVRHRPGRADQVWRANPYWVQIRLHPTQGPVPDYLTLKGAGREVELGAFLTPAERRALHDLLLKRLSDLRVALPPLA